MEGKTVWLAEHCAFCIKLECETETADHKGRPDTALVEKVVAKKYETFVFDSEQYFVISVKCVKSWSKPYGPHLSTPARTHKHTVSSPIHIHCIGLPDQLLTPFSRFRSHSSSQSSRENIPSPPRLHPIIWNSEIEVYKIYVPKMRMVSWLGLSAGPFREPRLYYTLQLLYLSIQTIPHNPACAWCDMAV